MSLKLRLHLAISLALAAMLCAAGVFLLGAAREDVRAEVQSTARLAMYFLDAELVRERPEAPPNALPRFGLDVLAHVRHVQIELFDAEGKQVESNHGAMPRAASAPAWFARLLAAAPSDTAVVRRPVVVNDRVVGELLVRPDPSFEVDEVWGDATRLAKLAALLFVLANALIYWLVGRALAPVEQISRAIGALERGRLDTRLPAIDQLELGRLGREFNRMMDTLEATVTQNRRLTQQLIRVQEEERRSLARELHDELGQNLSAIHADAVALLNAARAGRPASIESAQAIVAVVREILARVRGLLRRLHSETLDTLGLAEAVCELAGAWQARHPGVACEIDIDAGLDRLPAAVEVTAYRLVQESLTNVARHAAATRVRVALRIAAAGESLAIEIADDGRGIAGDPSPRGFGLAGMRERVDSLGGTFALATAAGSGTTLAATLPISRERLAA
jgi:two-component system sensor histidine kinase UhpB